MEDNLKKQETITKANERRMKYLQENFNSKPELITKYLDKMDLILKEISDDEEMTLMDLYRVFAFSIARITTSTYHRNEAEYQKETAAVHDKVMEYKINFLKQGTEEADPNDFKVSRLVMFAADILETTMWDYYLSSLPPEVLDIKNYIEEEEQE